MVNKLPRGSFFGQAHGQRQVSGITICESVYLRDQRIPAHEHASAFFDMVVDGACTEVIRGQSRIRDCSTLAFHPAGEEHSSCWHGQEPRCFHIEIPLALFAHFGQGSVINLGAMHFRDGAPVWLARRLHIEFQRTDQASPLAIEGLTLELLAECAREGPQTLERNPPRWLARVVDLLHADFLRPLTLRAIAGSAGIHPAHLTRVFREFHRCTIGDYVRKLRINFACRLLMHSDCPLTEIALRAGFSDQSHFSRYFKRQIGLTPAAFRESARPRKSDSEKCSNRPRT